ncbi:hypothetical protein [Xenophilus sp.]|uniref:hypothetical protein n=1 Tax=Xenophilus sp. TaxID=1873499 RepID=UPI0037DCE810
MPSNEPSHAPSDQAAAIEALLARGVAASQANDSRMAIELFRQACAQAPSAGLPQFLLGSEYAASGDMQAAEGCLANAVLLSPDLVLARYQLGLLQFSSARAAAALVTWQPLAQLPPSTPWPHWVRGFAALARDEFEQARSHLQQGIALNQENAALNADVHKVLEGIDALAAPADAAARTANTPSSSMPSEQLASDGEQAPREQTSNVQAMLASYAQNTRVH